MLWQFWTMAECKGTTSAEFNHSFIWLPVCLFFCTKHLMIKGLLVGVKFFTSRVDPKFIRSINTFWRSYFCSKCIQSTWFRVIFLFLKPKGKQIFCRVFIWQVRHFLLGKLPNALDIVGNKADSVDHPAGFSVGVRMHWFYNWFVYFSKDWACFSRPSGHLSNSSKGSGRSCLRRCYSRSRWYYMLYYKMLV